MSRAKRAGIAFEDSSGNVFADLGLEDVDELFLRSRLGFHVYKLITDRKLKQRERRRCRGDGQHSRRIPQDRRYAGVRLTEISFPAAPIGLLTSPRWPGRIRDVSIGREPTGRAAMAPAHNRLGPGAASWPGVGAAAARSLGSRD
jgi:hypothetical protein